MSFDERVESNKTASGIQEIANDDCVYACRESWNYQQAKIDAALKMLNDISTFEMYEDSVIKINKIKEILK